MINLIQKFNSYMSRETRPRHRVYFYLAAFISLITLPASALAETAAEAATTDLQSRHWAPTANDGGFSIALPAVSSHQLIGLIRTYQAPLAQREEKTTRYLDDHQLDAQDGLITAIMPAGLLYALVRKGNLEWARAELAAISEAMDELSRNLLAMQAEARELIVAQLQ